MGGVLCLSVGVALGALPRLRASRGIGVTAGDATCTDYFIMCITAVCLAGTALSQNSPPLRRTSYRGIGQASTLGSCLSGTLEAVVFTAPSSPIHLRRVECWRFTKDL